MNYSTFQQNIFDAVVNDTDNLMIEAVAGSGKTTTLQEITNRIPEDSTLLVAAFNKDIAETLKKRITHPLAQVCTLNSFGNQILSKHFGRPSLDKNKTDLILQEFVEENKWWKWRSSVRRLVELLRATMLGCSDLVGLADQFGLDLPIDPDFLPIVEKVYKSCLAEKTLIDFRDQVFMPIHYDLPIPQFDYVLVDEVQDLDANQAELIMRTVSGGGRLIMVGDSRQAIYGFRGAMASAMANLAERTKAKQSPLSVCYRCPKSVIKEAAKIVPQIEACDWAPEGSIETVDLERFRKEVAANDFVICRTVAPLVTECFGLIREGKRAMVKGRDIGDQLLGLISQFNTFSFDKFLTELKSYYRTKLGSFNKLGKEELAVNLTDRYDTIMVLAEGANSVSDVKNKIQQIFTDNTALSSVIFMTAHRAKGLESNRVFILAPELLPHPAAKQDWMKEQEKNLKYVALTRVMFSASSEGQLFIVRSH